MRLIEFRIENDVNDGGGKIEARLAEFVEGVLRPYDPGVHAAVTRVLALTQSGT